MAVKSKVGLSGANFIWCEKTRQGNSPNTKLSASSRNGKKKHIVVKVVNV